MRVELKNPTQSLPDATQSLPNALPETFPNLYRRWFPISSGQGSRALPEVRFGGPLGPKAYDSRLKIPCNPYRRPPNPYRTPYRRRFPTPTGGGSQSLPERAPVLYRRCISAGLLGPRLAILTKNPTQSLPEALPETFPNLYRRWCPISTGEGFQSQPEVHFGAPLHARGVRF